MIYIQNQLKIWVRTISGFQPPNTFQPLDELIFSF